MAMSINGQTPSGLVKNMSIKTAGMVFAALLVVAASINIVIERFAGQEVLAVSSAWADFETHEDVKANTVIKVREWLGYGGMIHELKNYILRGGVQRLIAVRSKLAAAEALVSEYADHGVNDLEIVALDELQRTITLYQKAADEAERLVAAGLSPREIDKAIEVDDNAALAALAKLETENRLFHAASTNRMRLSLERARQIVTNVEIVTVSLSAIMILFFLWYLIARVARPLSELSAAMKSLAQGDLEISIPALGRSGEIGEMASSVEVFQETAISRLRAEEALRDSERRLATAQQIAKLGHWEWDMATNKMFMSREIASMIGEDGADIDITYADYQKRIHPFDRDYVHDVMQKFRETRDPYDISYRIISKSGDISVLREKGEYQPGVDGNTDKAFGMIQDISDLSKAQESARESEEHIRLVVENVADGVITINEQGIVESFFGAAESIFGYSGEEVIGKNINMLMPDPHHSEHAGYLDAYVKGRGTGLVGGTGKEVNGRRKDGSLVPLELLISELHQRGKRKFVGTVRDISERKLNEQRMRDSNRLEAIGELAGGVAHDFNNILMVINGFTKRAIANIDNRQRLEESLGEVMKSAEKGATLTHQLLMFGRRELLESRVFKVSDQLRDYMPLLETLVGETIKLNLEIEDDTVCIETDPGELYQAVVNLAVNGRDAMPDGGVLTIRLDTVEFDEMRATVTPNASVGAYVRLSVTDNGYGMDDDTLTRVFEPFFTTKEQGKGTGLGLALVYGFIKQSNGVIEVDSSPGEGTKFSLYFKTVNRDPVVLKARAIAAHKSNNETLLLAEDDGALRMLAQEILEEHGYKVLVASDGVEALEIEDDYDGVIHLLITDVVMPGLSGFDVAEVLRQSRPETKVVFMSGYPARGQIQAVKIPNDAPFLQKPFPPERLAELIRETLADAPVSSSDAPFAASGD